MPKRGVAVRLLAAVLLLALVTGLSGCFRLCSVRFVHRLFGFGGNWYGQLGLGDTTSRLVPTEIPGLPNGAVAVACGYAHTLVLFENGDLYVFGRNRYGQLGLGDTVDRPLPTKLEGLPAPVRAVAAGFYHTIIVLANGDVYTCGANQHGQLGLGDTVPRSTPTRVAGLPGPAASAGCGPDHSFVILASGDVFAFGWNTLGMLGVGSWKDFEPTPLQVIGLPDRAVAATGGEDHSLILLANGDVYGFGSDWYGQLGGIGFFGGRIPLPGPAKAISAGNDFSLFLLENGQLYGTGDNRDGQLGLGDRTNRYVPTLIGTLSGPAAAITTGAYNTHVLLENGELYSFGENNVGQLGLGDTNRRLLPTRVTGLPAGEVTLPSAGAVRHHTVVIVRERIVE